MNLQDSSFQSLFWDTDPAMLDPEQHAAYILARTVERGTWEQWCAVRAYYGLEKIARTLTRVRGLSPHTIAFLATVLEVPRSSFLSSLPTASPWLT